ncbi:MAG: hypothetical protein HOH77_19550, partial [Candidatus Latescibacteria bacterium]|nr:hypothetical protein [Candidatus Latescibacterota bacterium]
MKKCACLMVLCLFVSPMWLDAAVVTKVSGKEIYVDAGKKDGVQIGTMMNVYRKKEIESEYGSMKFTTQIFLGRIMAYKVGSDNTVARVQEMTSVIDEGTQKAILKSDLVQPAFVVSADGLFR